MSCRSIAGHELTPGKPGEIRDCFGRSLFTEFASEDGVLLYRCASLNINEKGPMVSYGVPRHDP